MNEPWLDRWHEGRIGWHEADGNAGLKRFWRATGRHVLVPLCGKSPDILWLAQQGNSVSGIELSELAVKDFFAEQSLRFEVVGGPVTAYRALDLPITLYCGDFFELNSLECDAHFDRGALVAMPPERRSAYVDHVDGLLVPQPVRMVITLEYEQALVVGPPYSVEPNELLSYWPNLERRNERDDFANAPPKFRDAGLETLTEVVWQSS